MTLQAEPNGAGLSTPAPELSIVARTPPAAPADAGGYGSRAYRAYVLAALLLVAVFRLVDSAVMAILQEPIKRTFQLSDLQLGLMSGPAFALVFALFGVPIGRLADRFNRATIIALSLAGWSIMTALCGSVGSFAQLLVARVGVGIGEAGGGPPSQSLIADYFPVERRAGAMAILSLNVPLGAIAAAFSGGLLAQAYGWRAAFYILGFPGLLLAVVFWLTVREPRRAAVEKTDSPALWLVVRTLLAKPSFRHTAIAGAIAGFVTAGSGIYGASFLTRVYHLSLGQVAVIFGLTMAAISAISTVSSGVLSDRLTKRYPGIIAFLPGAGLLLAAPVSVVSYMMPTVALYLGTMLLAQFALSPMLPCTSTISQNLAGPKMRSTAAALMMLLAGIVGLTLGPPGIGALSDFLNGLQLQATGLTRDACALATSPMVQARCTSASANGLRYAMMAAGVLYAWAGVHFLLAARTYREDFVG